MLTNHKVICERVYAFESYADMLKGIVELQLDEGLNHFTWFRDTVGGEFSLYATLSAISRTTCYNGFPSGFNDELNQLKAETLRLRRRTRWAETFR